MPSDFEGPIAAVRLLMGGAAIAKAPRMLALRPPNQDEATPMTELDQSIAGLDTSIFRIHTQTSVDDQRSFLAVQNAVREWNPTYVYLECGSHVGGSLFPHVIDPRCRLAYSVDKRPEIMPDERGIMFPYPENSAQRMLALLSSHAPAESVGKVRTFDVDASELSPVQIAEPPDLVLIDAEHTNSAVFSDFLGLYRLSHPSTVLTFHDANLIFSGLQNIEAFLRYNAVQFQSYVLPSMVFVLACHQACDILRPVGEKLGLNREKFAADAKRELIFTHYDAVNRQLVR